MLKHLCFFVLIALSTPAKAQSSNKYQGLLWEITGNGLKKPSYLFGTMHVSNKLAFHLSDSFYHALRSVDAVALELNPEVWQGEMSRMEKMKENYAEFIDVAGNEYFTQNTFRIHEYIPKLKASLQTEPSVVNNLLHRSYKAREDFEEDTFLDMYIYQTGRKLGKKPAGVEDYYEAEKLVLEAYGDMAREKKKRELDFDNYNMRDILEKVQNAYRRGDLDLLDSLDNMMERSVAFREKFLFKRNEIQANAMDSIMKSQALFAGVGAAHLPGDRGVIEILRKKGYNVRAVTMSDRDGVQKNTIDKLKVPVTFKKYNSADNFFSVDVPGELYQLRQEDEAPDRWQFADMSNGSYYIVTRIKTYGSFLNIDTAKVFKSLDSLLYENIPGKILTKKKINRNGYSGMDISARTRRGDLQRYNIFVTPFEIIIFKISGKDDYTAGEEGDRFLSSIDMKELQIATKEKVSLPGFEISFPHQPHVVYNKYPDKRWEYEAIDANGNAYMILKRSLYHFRHIDQDSFNLEMMEESFRNRELFANQVNRRQTIVNGFKALEVTEQLKDSSLVYVTYIINGPHYYALASRNKQKPQDFFTSFKIKPQHFSGPQLYVDSILNMSVTTPVVPGIPEDIRQIVEKNSDVAFNGENANGYFSYWPRLGKGVFYDERSGEMMSVQVQGYPAYFSIRDSLKFWDQEASQFTIENDLYISSKQLFNRGNTSGVKLVLRDTGSTRMIHRHILLDGKTKYILTTVADSVGGLSAWQNTFFETFNPYNLPAHNIYESRVDAFFKDLSSSDSLTRARAKQALKSVYYGIESIDHLVATIQSLSIADKDYYEIKSNLIAELGFVYDSTGKRVANALKNVYASVGDTVLFQNEVVQALARQRTKQSYTILEKILLKDPPIFQNSYDYGSMFRHFEDSLELSAHLFPGLLNLTGIDDYKELVLELLTTGVDSGYIDRKKYKDYVSRLLLDAKVAMKKMRNRDYEILLSKKEEEEDAERIYSGSDDSRSLIESYAVLLMPYYEKNDDIRKFFQGVMGSLDEETRIFVTVLMLRHNKPVPDSVLNTLASHPRFSTMLYDKMETAGIQSKFPVSYINREAFLRSYILRASNFNKIDSLEYAGKEFLTYKGKSGLVYFYKYRVHKDHDWKIAFAGVQPVGEGIWGNPDLSYLTGVKLNPEESDISQFKNELKKLIFESHPAGENFFVDKNDYSGY